MDDGVEITDVDEDGVPQPQIQQQQHHQNLQNQDLSFIQHIVGGILSQYGWYLLLLTVVVYLLVQYLSKRRASNRNNSVPETVQDPVFVVRRQEAVEAARKRMQDELDAKAALFREKQLQLEEEKRRQKIEMWDSMKEGKSYKAKNAQQNTEEESSTPTVLKPKSDKKSLRSTGYNPLSGEGGGASCSWRPGRRGPSAGG